MNDVTPPRRILKGAWPLWILAAFFGVIFIANGLLVYLGNASWSGLATEDAYEKGRLYNRDIAAGDRQRQLGWQGVATLDGARLTLTLTAKTGAPVAGAKVRAVLRRPTHEGHDVETALFEDGPGRYIANVTLPLPGQWESDFRVVKDADAFRLKQRFTVK